MDRVVINTSLFILLFIGAMGISEASQMPYSTCNLDVLAVGPEDLPDAEVQYLDPAKALESPPVVYAHGQEYPGLTVVKGERFHSLRFRDAALNRTKYKNPFLAEPREETPFTYEEAIEAVFASEYFASIEKRFGRSTESGMRWNNRLSEDRWLTEKDAQRVVFALEDVAFPVREVDILAPMVHGTLSTHKSHAASNLATMLEIHKMSRMASKGGDIEGKKFRTAREVRAALKGKEKSLVVATEAWDAPGHGSNKVNVAVEYPTLEDYLRKNLIPQLRAMKLSGATLIPIVRSAQFPIYLEVAYRFPGLLDGLVGISPLHPKGEYVTHSYITSASYYRSRGLEHLINRPVVEWVNNLNGQVTWHQELRDLERRGEDIGSLFRDFPFMILQAEGDNLHPGNKREYDELARAHRNGRFITVKDSLIEEKKREKGIQVQHNIFETRSRDVQVFAYTKLYRFFGRVSEFAVKGAEGPLPSPSTYPPPVLVVK